MSILPLASFDVRSSLTPAQVREALAEQTTESSFVGSLGGRGRSFSGWIDEDEFRLRHVTWSNGFRAVVSGTIDPADSGSRVVVRMRPEAIAIALLAVMLGVLAWDIVLALWAALAQPQSLSDHIWSPVFFLVVYGIALWGFRSDANECQLLIERFLEAASAG